MNRSLGVAEDDRSQIDRFDGSGGSVDGGDITDSYLVFEDEEEAADDVADQRLRTKPYGKAGNAGAGQDRGDIDADALEHHQRRGADHQRRRDLLNDGPQGAGALCTLERIQVGSDAEIVFEPAHQQRGRPYQCIGEDDDEDGAEPGGEAPVGELPQVYARARTEPGELEGREEQERKDEQERRAADDAQRCSN